MGCCLTVQESRALALTRFYASFVVATRMTGFYLKIKKRQGSMILIAVVLGA